jgi:hypothetical protein
LLVAKRFQHSDPACLKDEHRVGLVALMEKVLVRRDEHDRTQREQELKDIRPDSTKNGHALEKFEPRFDTWLGGRQVVL